MAKSQSTNLTIEPRESSHSRENRRLRREGRVPGVLYGLDKDPITFSLDGKYAYPSTGEVIDTKTRAIVTALADENGKPVHSEKMVEVHWDGDRPTRSGDQFGIGRRA